MRVGRAQQITGPYIDRDGKPMLEGGGTLLLATYDHWRGPGHNGIYVEPTDGNATTEAIGHDQYWIVYHAYDAQQVGIPKLRIELLGWDEAGWPQAPSQTGE